MQPRVIAILVARNGGPWLERTLTAIAEQKRAPDARVFVDAASGDGGPGLLALAGPTQFVTTGAVPFGAAVSAGLHSAPVAESAEEWLWLLSADTAPEPDALAALLAAVEVAPSVAIAGPKLVDPDDRSLLRSYGLSISRLGATVPLVDGELDQAQYDSDTDVLGVAEGGMLVRRAVWERLGGFDPGLPSTDAALDFSIRTRLAGHRVVRVPAARVSRALRPEDFGRRKPAPARTLARLARTAQLHRRMAYAPGGALLVHWLSLVPLAVLRSIGHLLGKRPGQIGGEFAAAFATAFGAGGAGAARRQLRAVRSGGWDSIAPLRVPGDELRERRAATQARLAEARALDPDLVRAAFFTGGGFGVFVVAALAGVAVFWRLVGATALTGGALLPLSASVDGLWAQLGLHWRALGVGFLGAADPFAAVLAVLGSLTFWDPSFSLVLLWITALPFAALGAWWCATRLSTRGFPPVLAALLWMLAPPLLGALADGRPAAVLVHLLLPWLVLAALEAPRSWSAAATASLLFAAVTACAPVLFPVLLIVGVAWAFAHPRALVRLIGLPIPALALFAPLAVQQVQRGTPFALLADPGATVPFTLPSGWQTLLGAPSGGGGWVALAGSLGIGSFGVIAPAILLAPLAVVALLALFLPGARRAIPATIVALAGLVTAVVATHLAVAAAGSVAVNIWPGSALSLYWLGLLGAAVVALETLGRAAVSIGVGVLVTAIAAVAPVLAMPALGQTQVTASTGSPLPALVTAESSTRPGVGTLVLLPQSDGSLGLSLQRGAGVTLDGESTLLATRTTLTPDELALADFGGDLASRSSADPSARLQSLAIGFIVLPPDTAAPGTAASAVRQRASEALDSTPVLESVGETPAGSLWRFAQLGSTEVAAPVAPRFAGAVPIAQGIVVLLALLLAIPTRRRRRVVRAELAPHEAPADTFTEDDDD